MGQNVVCRITVRLPEPLHQHLKKLAKKRRTSINQLVWESLEALARQALEEELRAAYDALGGDQEMSDVERIVPAMREVLAGE